ncbi:MAG: ABC transporter permease [Clostridia bacterium]|nr:ABC transporter permease [Clostridia bacterium]
MKKYNYSLIIGLVLTGALLLFALIGQFWTPYSITETNVALKNAAPSMAHLMGCDNLGRDILSRVMNGCGTTFLVAVLTVAIGCVFGVIFGALTGFYGGRLDKVIMRLNDILLSFPSVLLVLIFISVIGKGKYNIVLALGILFIPSFVRMVRSEVIRYKEQEFVKSAKVLGAGNLRIIFVHILPNLTVSMLTTAAIGFNNAVLAEASMSYLGLGVQPPEPSLGRMLSEAQGYVFNAPWYAIWPGVVIVLIILGFSLISEGLRKMTES